jgi:hypothetical protein
MLPSHYLNVRCEIMFPPELERDAFRTENGELGWAHDQIPQVVNVLRSQELAILGGELWWVKDGSADCDLHIPQRDGRRTVYVWSSDRLPAEPWTDFVERGAADALARLERWPTDLDLPPDLKGHVLCSLSWVSRLEFDQLRKTKP